MPSVMLLPEQILCCRKIKNNPEGMTWNEQYVTPPGLFFSKSQL
jgi:hypothetical protein